MTKKYISRSYLLLSSLLVSSIFSLNVQAQSNSPSPDAVSGFIQPDSMYVSVEDRNKDGLVDRFVLTNYSSEHLSSYVYRDSSRSFRKISESSSVVFEEEFFEDNDFDGSFENKYSFEENFDGSLHKVDSVHMDESFIRPFKYFPKGTYVLKNSFLQLSSVSKNSDFGSLKFGTLSVNDNNLDGLVDEYFFQLNYDKGVVRIELKDRDSDSVFESSKVFVYGSDSKFLYSGVFPNSSKLVSYLSKLPEDIYVISSLGEIVKRVRDDR